LIEHMRQLLHEQTTWAQASATRVAERDEIIRALQTDVATQAEWAERSVAAVAERDTIIRALQAELATRAVSTCDTPQA
jgi:hypothetical protein